MGAVQVATSPPNRLPPSLPLPALPPTPTLTRSSKSDTAVQQLRQQLDTECGPEGDAGLSLSPSPAAAANVNEVQRDTAGAEARDMLKPPSLLSRRTAMVTENTAATTGAVMSAPEPVEDLDDSGLDSCGCSPALTFGGPDDYDSTTSSPELATQSHFDSVERVLGKDDDPQAARTAVMRPPSRSLGASPALTPSLPRSPSFAGSTGLARTGSSLSANSAKKEFDRFSLPSEEDMRVASKCQLVGESGETVEFGELIRQRGKRVVVVFLRHLWCGLCAHGEHITSPLPPLYIILVSSGSPSLIPIYRQKLDCVFPLYVDKRRSLYKALGMTLKSWSAGREAEKGSYVTMSMAENVGASIRNGLTMRSNPGSQRQLGGEFVFTCEDEDAEAREQGAGPEYGSETEEDSAPLRCVYASRMNTTRSHSEVRDLFAAAGVQLSAEDAASVFSGNSGMT